MNFYVELKTEKTNDADPLLVVGFLEVLVYKIRFTDINMHIYKVLEPNYKQ